MIFVQIVHPSPQLWDVLKIACARPLYFDYFALGPFSALAVSLYNPTNATHKTPLIRNWLAKRPRWHVHLTPTSSSWLNQVERFFALITERKIRRGIHRNVAALRAEITSFIEHHNANPRPFRWTKSADDILSSIERFCAYNLPAKA